MQHPLLVTDGACLQNPGPGGWACILRIGNIERELSGREPHTTNNRMEMTAAIRGLMAADTPSEVEIVTDSKYLLQGATEFLPRWKRAGWKHPVESRYKTRICGSSWKRR
jgi:ribonuclease HI